MNRTDKQGLNAVTYTYEVTSLSKVEMLGYICDILADDDITSHGVILTSPAGAYEEWSGLPIELPEMPLKEVFVESYRKVPLSCVTAIMEYHGQTMMISYRPNENTISVILPSEFRDTIDDVEKNVIPDAIDDHPAD